MSKDIARAMLQDAVRKALEAGYEPWEVESFVKEYLFSPYN